MTVLMKCYRLQLCPTVYNQVAHSPFQLVFSFRVTFSGSADRSERTNATCPCPDSSTRGKWCETKTQCCVTTSQIKISMTVVMVRSVHTVKLVHMQQRDFKKAQLQSERTLFGYAPFYRLCVKSNTHGAEFSAVKGGDSLLLT